METQATNVVTDLAERSGRWLAESIFVKLLSIGFLTLILLIPSAWIQDLMYERSQRADDVLREVAGKWSGSQTLAGPVLVIPYTKTEIVDLGGDKKDIKEVVEKAFFLPEQLTVNGTVTPETLNRSLFDVTVYNSSLSLTSSFAKPDFKSLGIPEETIRWNEAHLIFGITDIRGISDNPVFKIGKDTLSAEPSNAIGIRFYNGTDDASETPATQRSDVQAPDAVNTFEGVASSGMITRLNWTSAESFNGAITLNLSLKGSSRLDFVPTGKTTDVKLAGTWSSPSFDGNFLPINRNVGQEDFSSEWKVLHFNRPFSQQWTGDNVLLSKSSFGVRLLVPVDQYQKSIRTAKYGILIIMLTFIALFLVEMVRKIRIHPFQYILVGAALTVYYTLLLSISEHLGYNLAYAISSLATVLLIGTYSTTFLRKGGLVALFMCVLTIFYGFIFVIILQQDFSLLLGSIGLFLIVGIIMYFSRRVKWYKEPVIREA